ncbi:hypothetical protein QG083_10790, partial [Kingella kingae]|uniref:hypothetical protein n=1 Tax=Kingella kingae TaxID=504 RepID=UPI00255016E3
MFFAILCFPTTFIFLITTFIFQLLGNWNSVNSTQAWVERLNAMLSLNHVNENNNVQAAFL